MRHTLQLVAAFLLLSLGTAAHAQITNPDKLIAPPPPNPARAQRPTPEADLQWLWAFTKPTPNGRAYDLRVDGRFQAVLAGSFKQQQAMWGSDKSHPALATVIPLFLSKYGEVNSEDNRYITVDGCVPSFCPAHGMLWVDLGTRHPLMVFAAVNWSTENHPTDDAAADYNLWLFPNRELSADALPLALTESLAHWDARLAAAHRSVPHISHAILVEPSGQPFALDPAMTGANTLKPQPDTVTPREADDD
ncbi:MAG TPA: hypothetical protein VGN16_19730 [Acidobacteriaceae bacterium]|jgi:hypothetical protein